MRLEEKENELKREYNKLHERYTEVNCCPCATANKSSASISQQEMQIFEKLCILSITRKNRSC